MDNNTSSAKKRSYGKLVVPSLVLSRLNMTPPRNVAGLLLIDIGLTFGYAVGVMGQIRTASSATALVFALLMGVLSVRFRHKSLLLVGLIFYSISALGCYLAPDFSFMLILYSLSGIGLAMVSPMAFALVGELLPLEKRASATGWIFAGTAISSLIQFQLIGYIADIGGWRMVFLGFVLPLALASLAIAYFGIPSRDHTLDSGFGTLGFLEGFKKVFSNRSAVACLMGTTLSWASYQLVLTYGVSFYRQVFSMPMNWASILFSGLALCYTVGNVFSGRYINKFGRKPLTVIGYLFLGLFTMIFTGVPGIWLSVALVLACLVFVGIGDAASNSLTLEQIPKFRGTMMSVWSAATSFGAALGAGIGGVILLQSDYSFLGIVLGSLGIASSMIYHFFVTDPTLI